MRNLEEIKFIFEIIAVLIAFGGLIFAYVDSKKERKDSAYRKLGDSYIEILKLCADDYKLDCFDVKNGAIYELTVEQIHKQKIIYAMLINHFEQAYNLLRKNKDVWNGWELYFKKYFVRTGFLDLWFEVKEDWSARFRKYINEEIIKELSNNDLIDKKYLSQLK